MTQKRLSLTASSLTASSEATELNVEIIILSHFGVIIIIIISINSDGKCRNYFLTLVCYAIQLSFFDRTFAEKLIVGPT